jgi:hypothetical protein
MGRSILLPPLQGHKAYYRVNFTITLLTIAKTNYISFTCLSTSILFLLKRSIHIPSKIKHIYFFNYLVKGAIFRKYALDRKCVPVRHTGMGSNFDRERTDVCKQELIVSQTYTHFNHNKTLIILSQYQQYFKQIIILNKTAL